MRMETAESKLVLTGFAATIGVVAAEAGRSTGGIVAMMIAPASHLNHLLDRLFLLISQTVETPTRSWPTIMFLPWLQDDLSLIRVSRLDCKSVMLKAPP